MKKFLFYCVLLAGLSLTAVQADVVHFSPPEEVLPGWMPGETQPDGNPVAAVFITFVALVAVIPVVTEFLKKLLFKGESGFGIQMVSWITGMAVTMAGWWLDLGFLSGMSAWLAMLYGLGASLAANGIFDTGLITALFELFAGNKQAKT